MNRSSALTARARRYLADAAHAFDHAPVEVTLSVVLAATFSYAVASVGEPLQEWFELAVVILLTGAIAFTATLLHALGAWRERTRWIVTVSGALAATLYGMVALDLSLAGDAWRAAGLVIAAVLIVLSAPSLARHGTGAAEVSAVPDDSATNRFRRVTGRLVLRTIAVLLYATALYAGLALALGAINTLFELRLDGRIYAHTLGWVFFVLVTWVIVGGLADYVRPGSEAGPVAAAVHRISAFLVTPLLAIYYLILYAYAVRIAVTGELPKNLVSPLVIAAGVIAGLALVLFDRSALDPTGGSAPRRSLRITAPLFVPLCALGIWAISIRLGQYGWTEFRGLRMMLLITLGVLAVAAAVRGRRPGSLPVHVLPLTLALMLVVSVTGPWSLIAASRRSQQARLGDAMRAAGIEWNATAVRDTLIANEPHREITETARYLVSHFGADALPPLFARHADGPERFDVVYAAGLRPARPDLEAPLGGFGQLENGAVIDETGEGTLHYIRLNRPAMRPGRAAPAARPAAGTGVAVGAGDPAAPVVADTGGPSLTMRIPVAGMNLLADLTPISTTLLRGPPGSRETSHDFPGIQLIDEQGRPRGDLYVLEIGIGDGEVYHLTAIARLARP